MSGGRTAACNATWHGWVETPRDALLIFEACFNGTLSHCFRRPHDRERAKLIASGNVFVYEEATSGIKRWTDGIPWSPSRILTNFLIYRQLHSAFPAGEKKKANRRTQRDVQNEQNGASPGSSSSGAAPSGPLAANGTSYGVERSANSSTPPTEGDNSSTREEATGAVANRGLVGSLIDSYEFKEGGLLKKTMTVRVNNVQHHLVSYYSVHDVQTKLKTPRDDPKLSGLEIRPTLLRQSKFKCANLDDPGDGSLDGNENTPSYPQYYQPSYEPARMYSAPHSTGYPVPNQHYYHHGYAPYPYQPAPTAYGPAPAPAANYHHAPPAHHYAQHQPHYYHPQGSLHQPYQYLPHQAPTYPPHYYPPHPTAATHTRPPEARSDQATSRVNGHYEYENAGHVETGNDVYGPSSMTAAPSTENAVSVPQTQPAQTWSSYPHHQPYSGYRQ